MKTKNNRTNLARLATVLVLAVMTSATAWGQMTFELYDITYDVVAERDSKGFTTLTLPVGTDLSGLITDVWVDGKSVSPSDVTPNPTTTTLHYDEPMVFTYDNKAYGFRFVEDVWFCGVFISDCHINQIGMEDGTIDMEMRNMMNNILNMGKYGKQVNFNTDGATELVPKTNIIFCLGDMDQDKGDDGSSGTHRNFLEYTADLAKEAKIPFIFIAGNHDLSPDYWNNGDAGVTYGSGGGSRADDQTINAIKNNNTYWNATGVFDEDVQYFTGSNGSWQPSHFTFKYKGVRFYCANGYWFQKPYDKPELMSSATYYAPDDIISALSTFVNSHKDEASVWMQHYPWVAGDDCNRWWLDQNASGQYIPSSNSSIYGSSDSNISQNDATTAKTLKKDPLSAIMSQAAGKVDGEVQHFSGHNHIFNNEIYTNSVNPDYKVRDYTVAAPGNSSEMNNAYVVLFKRGEGVKEVIRAQF